MDESSPAPVARLITLGEPYAHTWRDYAVVGITAEHVPDLVRILRAPEYDLLPPEDAEVWAPVHAWRALAQLRAPEVVELLIERLDEFTDDEWDDTLYGDFSEVMARVGPPALEPLIAYLTDPAKEGREALAVSGAIAAVAKAHPENRARALQVLMDALRNWRDQTTDHNSGLISALIDLRAQDAMPIIREAMEAGAVEEMLIGSVDWVEYDLGLRDRPPTHRYQTGPLGQLARTDLRAKQNARERARARRKQAKAAKKRNRRK